MKQKGRMTMSDIRIDFKSDFKETESVIAGCFVCNPTEHEPYKGKEDGNFAYCLCERCSTNFEVIQDCILKLFVENFGIYYNYISCFNGEITELEFEITEIGHKVAWGIITTVFPNVNFLYESVFIDAMELPIRIGEYEEQEGGGEA